MRIEEDESKIATHNFPIWRNRADFIIAARLVESDINDLLNWEQVWVKQIEQNVFEICCIPFFIYKLALGDLVETAPRYGRRYVINRIIKASGHTTFRVWFHSKADWNSTIGEIQNLGCLVEARWEKSGLIGVDAPNSTIRGKLEHFLKNLEATTLNIEWEIGN